jgi:hypothetical protein
MNNAETLRKLAFLAIVEEAESIPVERTPLVLRKVGTSKGILIVSIDYCEKRHIVKIDHNTCDVIGNPEICEESRHFRLTNSGYRLDFPMRHKLQTGIPIVEFPS